ncbi:hypothetical protein N6B72_09690 [Chryseobacterium soli]|uniref:hypothetical protein n=1 Tax=Chryseobacterium soli TaxID=445961 RepID=UPI0029555EFF|nr:hypothetical protein [Chryseobacterium soli]MDV7697189.1 hypothetical protein [Chryseobacterium soli]
MLKYFIVLLTFISIPLSSQINTSLLSNSWTRVKVKTEDGSRALNDNSSTFIQWKLVNNRLCKNYNPNISFDSGHCTDYKVEKNFIRFSPTIAYEIEKLDNDSLIVIERFEAKKDPDKALKFWFVKTSNIEKKDVEKNQNDSVLIADTHFAPKLRGEFLSDKLTEYALKGDFKLIGNILIYPKKQKVIFEIDNSADIKGSAKVIKNIQQVIENSYYEWNLVGFKNFEKIYVPFTVESYHKNSREYSIKINFPKKQSVNTVTIPKETVSITSENPSLSKENFTKGMEALKLKKYDAAIGLFEKAYGMDNTNTDALYNIAAAASIKNDIVTVCDALKRLKDLEQTEGTRLYHQTCQKP